MSLLHTLHTCKLWKSIVLDFWWEAQGQGRNRKKEKLNLYFYELNP